MAPERQLDSAVQDDLSDGGHLATVNITQYIVLLMRFVFLHTILA